jgi:hypothetical protein
MRRVRKHTSGCVVRLSQRLDPEILLHYGIGFSLRGRNEEQPSRVFQVPHQRKLLASQWNEVEVAKCKKSSAWQPTTSLQIPCISGWLLGMMTLIKKIPSSSERPLMILAKLKTCCSVVVVGNMHVTNRISLATYSKQKTTCI